MKLRKTNYGKLLLGIAGILRKEKSTISCCPDDTKSDITISAMNDDPSYL